MNHIKTIEIKNFKSIRHQKIEDCRRINVFIGYPNTGKSNILEAMGLFEINNIADNDVRDILRFETYTNLFYNNNFKNSIEVKLDESERIELKVVNKELHLRSEDKKMFFEMEIPLTEYRINAMAHGSTASDNYDSLERMQIKKYSFREGRGNYYPPNFSKELIPPFGENLADVINSNQELRKSVVEIFKNYNLKYATDENNDIRIIKEYGDQEVKIFPYIQIADTIRRLIFYKAAIASNRESVLLFEEPEAHMFPPYISQLTAEIIFDENKNQYFIATHSPFVLNDFMEDMDKNELAIYAVGYKRETGETIIRRFNDNEIDEIYQYGIDLFFNLENYLMHEA